MNSPTIENGVPRTVMPDMNQGSISDSISSYTAHLPLLGSTIAQEFQSYNHYFQKSMPSPAAQSQSLGFSSPTSTRTRYPSQGSEPVDSSREQRLLRHIQMLRERQVFRCRNTNRVLTGNHSQHAGSGWSGWLGYRKPLGFRQRSLGSYLRKSGWGFDASLER